VQLGDGLRDWKEEDFLYNKEEEEENDDQYVEEQHSERNDSPDLNSESDDTGD
jgi:hypothetical protein